MPATVGGNPRPGQKLQRLAHDPAIRPDRPGPERADPEPRISSQPAGITALPDQEASMKSENLTHASGFVVAADEGQPFWFLNT
jgi:hypothetical protein